MAAQGEVMDEHLVSLRMYCLALNSARLREKHNTVSLLQGSVLYVTKSVGTGWTWLDSAPGPGCVCEDSGLYPTHGLTGSMAGGLGLVSEMLSCSPDHRDKASCDLPAGGGSRREVRCACLGLEPLTSTSRLIMKCPPLCSQQ